MARRHDRPRPRDDREPKPGPALAGGPPLAFQPLPDRADQVVVSKLIMRLGGIGLAGSTVEPAAGGRAHALGGLDVHRGDQPQVVIQHPQQVVEVAGPVRVARCLRSSGPDRGAPRIREGGGGSKSSSTASAAARWNRMGRCGRRGIEGFFEELDADACHAPELVEGLERPRRSRTTSTNRLSRTGTSGRRGRPGRRQPGRGTASRAPLLELSRRESAPATGRSLRGPCVHVGRRRAPRPRRRSPPPAAPRPPAAGGSLPSRNRPAPAAGPARAGRRTAAAPDQLGVGLDRPALEPLLNLVEHQEQLLRPLRRPIVAHQGNGVGQVAIAGKLGDPTAKLRQQPGLGTGRGWPGPGSAAPATRSSWGRQPAFTNEDSLPRRDRKPRPR